MISGQSTTLRYQLARRIERLCDADIAHLYATARRQLVKNLCAIEAGRRLRARQVLKPLPGPPISAADMAAIEAELSARDNVRKRAGKRAARAKRVRRVNASLSIFSPVASSVALLVALGNEPHVKSAEGGVALTVAWRAGTAEGPELLLPQGGVPP